MVGRDISMECVAADEDDFDKHAQTKPRTWVRMSGGRVGAFRDLWGARIGVTRSTQAWFLTADRQCTELPLLRLPWLVPEVVLWAGKAGAPGGTVRRAAARKRGSGSASLR